MESLTPGAQTTTQIGSLASGLLGLLKLKRNISAHPCSPIFQSSNKAIKKKPNYILSSVPRMWQELIILIYLTLRTVLKW